jgi:hypothetical protein
MRRLPSQDNRRIGRGETREDGHASLLVDDVVANDVRKTMMRLFRAICFSLFAPA